MISCRYHLIPHRYHLIPLKYHLLRGKNRMIHNRYHLISRKYYLLRDKNHMIPNRYHLISRKYHILCGKNRMIPDRYHLIRGPSARLGKKTCSARGGRGHRRRALHSELPRRRGPRLCRVEAAACHGQAGGGGYINEERRGVDRWPELGNGVTAVAGARKGRGSSGGSCIRWRERLRWPEP
uniref:Uncharacterized protein n=1 Tax=Oryza barthii TaxID=65489 RepID=A0A0D3F354_9ORYZ